MERHIAYLHIPSFGLALARASDACLRQRPIAIAPVHSPRALVREVSMEASKEGVTPGMPVGLARRLCPALRLIPPDLSRIRAAQHALHHTIAPYAPVWEPIRPGSLFVDLTGTTRLLGPSIDTAAHLAQQITQDHGLHSVVGLAGSKLVSQLAAVTLERPPQLFSVTPGSEQSFLAPLPTTLLPGLHPGQASRVWRRLDELNLHTLGSIAAVPLTHLQSVFGASAGWLHDWAWGIDASPVCPPAEYPSIERSLILTPDDIDEPLLLGRLYGLVEQVCTTLRQQRRVCRQIILTIRHSDQEERAVRHRLACGTCWETDLYPLLTRLFVRCFRRRVRLRRMTLRVDHLTPTAEQLSLFETSLFTLPPPPHRLSLAMDQIRTRFGERALVWGRTL